MSEHFVAVSSTGETLEIFALGSGLTSAIYPSVTHANPFAGSEHFRSASGQQVRQTRPGVFMVVDCDVEYGRVMDQAD